MVISEVIKCFNFFVLDTYSPNATGSVETLDDQTETESVVSFRRERPRHRESMEQHGEKKQIAALLRSAFFLLLLSTSGTLPSSKRLKDCDIIKECREVRNVYDLWRKQGQRGLEQT